MRWQWMRGLSAAGNAGVIVFSLTQLIRHLSEIWIRVEYGQTVVDLVSTPAKAFGWIFTFVATAGAFWWGYHRDWASDIGRAWFALISLRRDR